MEYSIIIPVFNSESTLLELFNRLQKVISSVSSSYEIIFVDDYSRDDSWKKLNEIYELDPKIVKIIRLSKNFGQHNATLCGLRNSKGSMIFTMDDDLQFDPEDFTKLVLKQKETSADVVYGTTKSTNNMYRKVGSRIVKHYSTKIDNGVGEASSFRLVTRVVVDRIIQHPMPFVHIDEILYWHTSFISYTPINHHLRPSGKSGYTVKKIASFISGSTWNYGVWPLTLMIYGGLFLAFISAIIGVYFIYKKFTHGTPVPGFTALIAAILFSTSLILICFGIIGHYISNMYSIVYKKPSYSIREKKD